MAWFDKLTFWKAAPSDIPSAVSEMIPLNPNQMLLVESMSKELGLDSGLTSLSRQQYERLIPMFQASESFRSNYQTENSANYHVAAGLAAIYTKAIESRKELIRQVDSISSFYLVDVIISQFADDALSPDVSSDQIFELTSENEKIHSELKHLEKKFKLDRMVKEIIPDVLRYGEYTLSTVIKTSNTTRNERVLAEMSEAADQADFSRSDEGLVQLNDGVDQTEVVAISKNTDVEYYLNMVERNGHISLERKHKSAYVQFRMESERIRIDLGREFSNLTPQQKELISRIPRFVRIGKSLIYSVIPKIRELELLEKLAPATKLSELAAGTLIGVQVPPSFKTDEALKVAKTLENIINRKLTVQDDKGRISVESILTSVGRTKVIPLFGGEKGSTSVMETRSPAASDLTSDINNLRKIILDAAGVPFELIFSSDATSKAEILKRYSRYLRKLKAIQRTVKEGLIQIAHIHLAAKGIPFQDGEVQVNFHNKLIELDNLDKLEYVDGSITLLTNIKTFVEDLKASELLGQYVDVEEFKTYLQEQFRLVGLEDLISDEPQEDEESDIDVDAEEPVDGEDPAADPTAEPGADPAAEAPAAPGSEEDLRSTTLNGAQVKSLLDVIGQVVSGQIPRDTGLQVLVVSFGISKEQADSLLGHAGKGHVAPQTDSEGDSKPTNPPSEDDEADNEQDS